MFKEENASSQLQTKWWDHKYINILIESTKRNPQTKRGFKCLKKLNKINFKILLIKINVILVKWRILSNAQSH